MFQKRIQDLCLSTLHQLAADCVGEEKMVSVRLGMYHGGMSYVLLMQLALSALQTISLAEKGNAFAAALVDALLGFLQLQL